MRDHHEFQALLNDFIDGVLDGSTQADVAAHTRECTDCAAELAELRSLLDETQALPKSIEPETRVWQGIENQLPTALPAAETQGTIQRSRPDAKRFSLSRWSSGLFAGVFAGAAAAAVLLVALFGPSRNSNLTSHTEAPTLGSSTPGSSLSYAALSPLVHALEKECVGSGRQLQAASRSTGPFGGEVAATVDQNVRILDLAIEETVAALDEHPEDPVLLQMLASRYQRKLALLNQATRLVREV